MVLNKKNNELIIFLFVINLIFFIRYNIDYTLFFLQFNLCCILLLNLIYKSVRLGSNLFYPLPITCIILLISCVIAPIISFGEKHYMFLPSRDIDWEKYLFLISLLYSIGIVFFYIVTKALLVEKKIYIFDDATINKTHLIIISMIFLIFSLVTQILIFLKFGGIVGYLTQWTEDRDALDGFGIWYMFAEPFPIILLVFLILLIGRKKILNNKYKWIILLFIIFFISKLLFGGFRGSRSNTIWGLFLFAGIVHIYLFKLKKIHYILGILFLSGFMSIYAVYKTYGVEAFSGDYTIEDTNRYEGNPLLSIYLGDFSRATVNAFQLAQLNDLGNYNYKWGQTYLYTSTMILPPIKNIYTGYGKNSAGYEIINNQNINPEKDFFHNSRVFGLYGEGILNFGPVFALFLFLFMAIFVVFLDNFCRGFLVSKVYIFLIPFLANLSFLFVVSDSDNIVFFLLKDGFLFIVYLVLIQNFSRKGISNV
ncbi:hypothetical protein [Acinetobacter variabilis]|uniref:hypothetical protein n=1 Tax=Acinetobacter variabilis TaxID=70346 RepID=UPI00289F7A12|nr:hypothetical protein [Acinetobacter variabilis]